MFFFPLVYNEGEYTYLGIWSLSFTRAAAREGVSRAVEWLGLSFEGLFMCLEQKKPAYPVSGCLGPGLREPCREQERKKIMSGKQYQRWLYLLKFHRGETYEEAGKASEWCHQGYCCCWLLIKTADAKRYRCWISAFRPFSSLLLLLCYWTCKPWISVLNFLPFSSLEFWVLAINSFLFTS